MPAVSRTLVPLLAALLAASPPPVDAQVPEPADVLGFVPGTDFRLAKHDEIVAYFRALDEASPRVVVEEIGRSTLGRPLILALVSSPENLAARERHRETAERLAKAELEDEAEARRLARDGRAVVWIDGGLHATEVAGAQFMPQMAHWLATDEGAEARRIRQNVITLLMPVMNPDGLDIVADWYLGNVGTAFETAPVPELYHHYVGHDNNRDWYMFTQVETQAVADQLYHVWFPQIVYNHHQSGPFPGRIWTPPFENPVNPNLDPLVVSAINHLGEAMKKRFDQEGKPGVSSGIVYDMWWNGSMRGAPDFHNMLGFLTETALYRYATPGCWEQEEIPETFGERAGHLPARRPTTNYTNPWMGGCWHLRDAMDYMETASRAVLDQAARLREQYLFDIWRLGRRQIERGRRAEGGPFAYVVDPGAQHDPGAAVELLRVFRQGGIEIHRAEVPFRAGGREFGPGTWVIGPQAFRPFVVDLMEPKTYPDRRQYPGGPPEPPYDMTGYELSLQMGVEPVRVREPFRMPGAPVEVVPPAPGGVAGDGEGAWVLPATADRSVTAAVRLLEAGAEVARTTTPFRAGGESWPAGSWIVRETDRETVDALARELGLEVASLPEPPGAEAQPIRVPRVGIYRGTVANMPEGWTRWILDRYGLPWTSVTHEAVRAGALAELDVLVLPDQDAEEILHGHEPGSMPPEHVGGLGAEGVEALRRWVGEGGWLLAVDEATDFAIEHLDLPVRNVVADLPPEEFFIPGSLLRVEVDAADPLAAGMPEEAIAFYVRGQGFEVEPAAGAAVDVFARFPEDGLLASGWAHGGKEHLAGRVAAVRVPLGEGQVVLTAFEPHFRGQPHNTFKLLFNPLVASTWDPAVWERSATERETGAGT